MTIKRAAYVALFYFFSTAAQASTCYVSDYQELPSQDDALAACNAALPAAIQCNDNAEYTPYCKQHSQYPDSYYIVHYGTNYSWYIWQYHYPSQTTCEAGLTTTQYTEYSSPSAYCDGSCSYTKVGSKLCVTMTGTTLCGAEYESTGEFCSTATTTTTTTSSCGTVDGTDICASVQDPGATENCMTVAGTYYCDGTLSYGDCYTMQDGSQICSTPINDPYVTDSAPKDPTTGETLTPSTDITKTADSGTLESKTAVYGSALLDSNNPYSCDNPDTAVWEPCPGYCDNPSTVINECEPDSKCVDDPNTLYDESALCSSTRSTDCGGFMQPPCDASGNPVTADTSAGNLVTADGIKITDAINNLGDQLSGWSEPVGTVQGSFDQSGATSELDSIKLEYESTLEQIKTEASNLFHLDTAPGTLPCWTNLSIPGLPGTYSMCPRNYEAQLSIIGVILLAIATLLAFIVLMR